jgi:glutathione S-transferase
LKEAGTGFLVGKFRNSYDMQTYFSGQTPTPADFFLADYLHTLLKLAPKLFDGHTDLKYFVERIYALPQLRNYIAKRLDGPL